MSNFVIFSPPGGGKSYINNCIAEYCDYKVFSCDDYMDNIFTSDFRLIVNNEDKYLKLKLIVIKNKLNDLFNKQIVLDLGGGTVFRQNEFIDFLKYNKIKIIYYDVDFDIIKKRLDRNKNEIYKRKFLVNKKDINNWQNTLLDYYTEYDKLKKYADYVIEYKNNNTCKNIIIELNKVGIINCKVIKNK